MVLKQLNKIKKNFKGIIIIIQNEVYGFEKIKYIKKSICKILAI